MATERIGRAVLEIVTDKKGFLEDVANIKHQARTELPNAFKATRSSLDNLAAGMSSAGKEASASSKLIAGMSDAGRHAADGLGKVNPVMSAMKTSLGEVTSSLGKMVAGFSIASGITTVIQGLASSIAQTAADGAKLSGVSQSFDQLTKSVGESGAAMLDATRKGSQGLIKDLDLIQASNKAILLGLPVTASEMGKLAQTATVLGRAMGQDATQSMDDLITALGRSSPMILDNLGLTVKLGEANETYAKQLGKSVDAMTEAEKKTAFYNAAMEAAEAKAEALGKTNLTVSEQVSRLGTALQNIAINAAAAANESGGLSGILGTVADAAARVADHLADVAEARKRLDEQGGPEIKLTTEVHSLADAFEAVADAQDLAGRVAEQRAKQLAVILEQIQIEKMAEQSRGERGGVRLPYFANPLPLGAPTLGMTRTASSAGIDAKRLEDQTRDLATKLGKVQEAAEEWAKKMREAAAETASWARNLQGQFLFDLDNAFFNSVSSDATKKLQALAMKVGTPGILPNLNAGLTAGLMLGPGRVSQHPFAGILTDFQGAWSRTMDSMIDGLENVERTSAGVWGDVANDMLNVVSAIELGKLGGERFMSGLSQLQTGFGKKGQGFEGVSNLAIGAFEAIGAMDAATGSGSRAKRVAGGAATGAKIGTMVMPVVGTAIGAGVGALVGVFRGDSDGQMLNKTRDSKIAQLSGLAGKNGESLDKFLEQDKFRELALAAGVANAEVDKLFSARRVAAFDSALDGISKKMSQFTSEQQADQERLQSAIERYGFTIEQLGPKFQKQRLDDQAKELIEDWRVLIGSGIEITDVNNGMSEAINEYLQTAIKLGTEVPNAMRPILDKMLDQGILTNEAGEAITDLEEAGVSFSETMTEGFDRVVMKLTELIDKLGIANIELGRLPTSAPNVAGFHDTTGLSASDIVPVPALGTGGIAVRPLLSLIGERGPEAVIPLDKLSDVTGGDPGVTSELKGLRHDVGALLREFKSMPSMFMAAAQSRA